MSNRDELAAMIAQHVHAFSDDRGETWACITCDGKGLVDEHLADVILAAGYRKVDAS